jgi:hypothetical protein
VYSADVTIADCIVGHEHPAARPSDEASEANARLIAAAPDLLAVAEAFIDYAYRRLDWGHHWTCDIKQAREQKCSCGWGEVLECFRAAIAKAEGGAS